jgi:glucokinase
MGFTMNRFYAAVDIGATNVRVALGDEEGLAEKKAERTDRENGAAGVSRQIIRMIKGLSAAPPASIGVGSIGPIDLSTGSIEDTPNFPFKVIPIVEPLREAFGVPVAMLNDCSAAVLGEREYGAGKGLDNLVYVTLSTGLGGGAIVDGHLLVGKDGNAVEVGHLTIDPDSPLVCGCGCRGHWEAYCSGANIPDYARLLLQGEQLEGLLGEATVGDLMEITSENLFDAARKGNSQALYVVRKIGEVNAVGFADIVNVFDPQLITVGGSIALRNPGLVLEPIKGNIRRHLINREPTIRITPLGDDAVLMGALALARNSTQ